jgi:serine phosphatase RsbU (regulator of sigma subunit)
MTSDDGFVDTEYFLRHLAETVAGNIYDDFIRIKSSSGTGSRLRREIENRTQTEKQFLIEYAAGIPEKFRALNLFLRPYRTFCRTCIITEDEIDAFTATDLDRIPGEGTIEERKLLFNELNYMVPASLKRAGYEIIRQEEVAGVTMSLVMKIARAIHASYLREIAKQASGLPRHNDPSAVEVDDLSAEILHSNIDNAAHIPTKLLSIGYRIRPVKKGYKPGVLHLNDSEVEAMARVEHLRWSWEKRINGWTFGKTKDLHEKTHPCLIPYDELDENEKEKDRELVRLIPALLQDIKYEAYAVSPEHTSKLSYALKPLSSIHKLLQGTNELSASINLLAEDSPGIREKLESIDEKIKLTISEVEGSYNYARHIQEAFLPDDLYIRECFPDSFVLFEPKDIVSGDFYFFSSHDAHVIFGLADCTGHGIPASLISTIGYGLLDQAVNILKITDTAEALRHLYSGIHRFLRKGSAEYGVRDDMTIVLCNFDTTTMNLTYSGAGNIIFHVTDGKISGNLSGNIAEEHFKNGTYGFTKKRLQLKLHDSLYICSDGFQDQMGGSSHQRYSKKRLRDFLMQINKHPMPEQGDLLYEEFDRWREEKNEDQTDDITIIGIRI